MAQTNCGCSCIQFTEGKRYSLLFEEDTIAVRESDGKSAGYVLKKVGATQSELKDGRSKVVVLFSFEEAE